ncbi:energy coupling factor transporter S component ThiW [Dethiosulfovibrio salsuginis]|uniref:Energy coupling factor transporter S component ThiW n=1 Tax=Dethiosulfovibrio salsuginis TaxID=561720 RepID=A0A1X7K2G8_9BACT|nr:energy coupling factor transporter S component ThiW [Dethiosulfovibrio salsuginis]SMG35087.1 energy coupling factor transporter S component ThiW [Dethiosulfovibrio salsuginis]
MRTEAISSVTLRRLTVAGLLTATALLLSGVSIPFGPTKCFPFQHTVNVVGGILLGPWWAAGTALVTSVLRVAMGTGTLFAFPGSVPGALAVGLAYRFLRKDWCALAEPLGTGPVGATLSALLIAPAMGKSVGFWALQSAFLTSAIPGCIIGYAVIAGLRKSGVNVD